MQTPLKSSGKDKIRMAMLKITYAPCGYVNVLPFSLTGWAGDGRGIFSCVSRTV